MPEEIDFHERMHKIEELIHETESNADPVSRARTIELMTLMMELHGAGLGRMLALIAQSANAGQPTLDRFVGDPLVASLLLLYGHHPVALETRVEQALNKVRPLLKSHGGDVELLGIDEGAVRLRLEGSCHGCPSSAQTLKNAIEEAIYEFAPDIVDLDVEGAVVKPKPDGFVSLEQLAVG